MYKQTFSLPSHTETRCDYLQSGQRLKILNHFDAVSTLGGKKNEPSSRDHHKDSFLGGRGSKLLGYYVLPQLVQYQNMQLSVPLHSTRLRYFNGSWSRLATCSILLLARLRWVSCVSPVKPLISVIWLPRIQLRSGRWHQYAS